MSRPRFSVILPTRNRAAILAKAVESVLCQDFADWELVIADNDDSEDATRKVVESFEDDRIRRIRSPTRMAMHDNWEFALGNATGGYIIVLEDKQRLSPGALTILQEAIGQTKAPLVTYSWGDRPARQAIGLTGLRRISSKDTIRLFCRFDNRCTQIFPRGMNCCISAETLAAIRAQRGAIFSRLTPDFVFGFGALLALSEYWFLPDVLVYSDADAARYSNGFAVARKATLSRKFFDECGLSEEEILAPVPIKSIWLLQNIVLYDYFNKFRPNCQEPWAEIRWQSYFVACIESVRFMQRQGTNVDDERREIMRALTSRSTLFKAQVAIEVAVMFAKRAALKLRNLLPTPS